MSGVRGVHLRELAPHFGEARVGLLLQLSQLAPPLLRDVLAEQPLPFRCTELCRLLRAASASCPCASRLAAW